MDFSGTHPIHFKATASRTGVLICVW